MVVMLLSHRKFASSSLADLAGYWATVVGLLFAVALAGYNAVIKYENSTLEYVAITLIVFGRSGTRAAFTWMASTGRALPSDRTSRAVFSELRRAGKK